MTPAKPNRPMRIAVDARPLNAPHLRGMGKYLFEVLRRLAAGGEADWSLYGDRPDWPFHWPAAGSAGVTRFECRGYRFRTWEQLGLPWRAARWRADLLFCPGTTLPWWQPTPTVVTIHDTMPWRTHEREVVQRRAAGRFLETVIPRAYRKASALITISQRSRADILSLWPELGEKLHVIRHGIGEPYLARADESGGNVVDRLIGSHPYFLYLGGVSPYKRLAWAVRVFQALGDPTARLVLCGVGKEAAAEVESRIDADLRGRVVLAPFISEDELPSLVRRAAAVLYPTLYEGFGLPALEAQAVGTPVLMSAVGSLVELQGPAAEVLPVEDLEAWVATCRRLLQQRGETPSPNEAARQWARQFSWDESAAKHLEVFRAAARKPAVVA